MTAQPRPRHRLRRLRVDRVDLVDQGAQPDAHIALFKRKPDVDDAKAELERLVASVRAADPRISHAEAVAKALGQRPDLFR